MATGSGEVWIDLTRHWVGFTALGIIIAAYAAVVAEEFIHLRKSKTVVLAAGVIWALIAYVYASRGFTHEAEIAARHNLLEYAELMLFLLVSMTYINAMEGRQAFDVFNGVARAEWDTLLFFYGVMLCVGDPGFISYLSLTSELMYSQLGAIMGLSPEIPPPISS